MSFPITATIEPEKLRAILYATHPRISPLNIIGWVLNGLVSAVCVKRISGGQGQGQEAESAGHFLLRPTLPQRTNFEVLARYGVFIKKALFQ